MARRKKPQNETQEEIKIRQTLEHISDIATRNEKMSWDRKMDNMVKLLAKIRPIEDQIIDLIAKKQPLFDEITNLRAEMIKDCIHPMTHLTRGEDENMGEYIECKFCNKRFTVVNSANE